MDERFQTPRSFKLTTTLLTAAIATSALAGVASAGIFSKDDAPKAARAAVVPVPGAPASFADLYESVKDSVVNIRTTKTMKPHPRLRGNPRDHFGGGPDDFWKRFFEMPEHMERQSLGTGFVVDKEGYILTNNHVVAGADEIKVFFADETELDAKIIGTDPKTDIALIQVESDHVLPYAELGDSEAVRIGEWVVAVGNPLGYNHTLTAGIISAKQRALRSPEMPQGIAYDDLIQTDASISPGNSGGPLFDMNGRVIGINTAIANPAISQGIGFAVPIRLAIEILDDLKTDGRVTRGWMGVMIQAVNQDIAASLGLNDAAGALVADLVEDGPAAKGELQRGDVIVRVGEKDIATVRDLTRNVAAMEPGTEVEVEVVRLDGRKATRETLTLEVGTYPSDQAAARGAGKESEILGIEVQALDKDLARSLKTEDLEGVVVTRIEPGGAADKAGLRPKDIIRKLNHETVASLDDFRKAVRALEAGEPALVLVERAGSTRFVTIRVDE